MGGEKTGAWALFRLPVEPTEPPAPLSIDALRLFEIFLDERHGTVENRKSGLDHDHNETRFPFPAFVQPFAFYSILKVLWCDCDA